MIEITDERTQEIIRNIIKDYRADRMRIKELRAEAWKLGENVCPENAKRFVEIIEELAILDPPDDDNDDELDKLLESLKKHDYLIENKIKDNT